MNFFSHASFCRISFIMVASVLWAYQCFAMEQKATKTDRIKVIEIASITELLSYFPNDADGVNLLVVGDWDKSIIKKNGDESAGLREGEDTRDVIQETLKRGYDFFVLTSRNDGASLFEIGNSDRVHKPQDKTIASRDVARLMHRESEDMFKDASLDIGSHQSFFFPPTEKIRCFELNDRTLKKTILGEDTALITPNVVFAGSRIPGGSIKGKTLVVILDLHNEALAEGSGDAMFTSQRRISHVLVFDDDYDHVEDIVEAFKNREEYVTVLFYPSNEI